MKNVMLIDRDSKDHLISATFAGRDNWPQAIAIYKEFCGKMCITTNSTLLPSVSRLGFAASGARGAGKNLKLWSACVFLPSIIFTCK